VGAFLHCLSEKRPQAQKTGLSYRSVR